MREFDQVRAFRRHLPGPSRAEVRSARARLDREIAGRQSHGIVPRKHRTAVAGALCFTAATLGVAAILLTGGASNSQPAYAAEVVRFAESTPLLLLEGPGWRVQNVDEAERGPYMPRGSNGSGSMEFITGKPIPSESVRATCVRQVVSENGKYTICKAERGEGMLPPAVRQRKVDLFWHRGSLAETLESAHRAPHPHGQHWTKLPVLGTTAVVDTRAEWFLNQGGPGDRQMIAFWSEGGYVLELRAAVPDLGAFEERLGWLNRVDAETWLNAMPPSVVKAADHAAVVHEMLRGIPLPAGFEPSQIPDEGITTSRFQLSGAVVNTVSCLWFRHWGAARASGDRSAKEEAERAMDTYRQWPILRQEAKEGGEYPESLVKLVASMPSGVWQFGPHRYRLLPKVEGLGCARWGIPVLPWKQRRQERRKSPAATASGPQP